MLSRLRLIFAVALALSGEGFAQIPAANPETVGVSSDRAVRIRSALQKEIDADRMPGAVVMIARRGQLIYSDAVGFQDKAAAKSMSKDAIFRIYSMTKPFTSVAVEAGTARIASHCVLFDPFEDACAIDYGAVRAGYPQDLVMVTVEVAGMKESGFPTIERSGGEFAAADPIDIDHVPLFFHLTSRTFQLFVEGYVLSRPAGKAASSIFILLTKSFPRGTSWERQ